MGLRPPWLLKTIFVLFVLLCALSCMGPHYYYIKKNGEKGVYHKVEAGQTVWRISRAYAVDIETVARVNRLGEDLRIEAGAYLFIPGVDRTLNVRPYPAPVTGTGNESPAIDGQGQTHGGIVFNWPVKGLLSSRFGLRNGKNHEGIDISAPAGSEIQAAADGVVSHSGWGPGEYGKTIIITHRDGFTTLYGHNSQNLVTEGATVTAGQTIGRVGRTGNATGYHVHFEIRKYGTPMNPLQYLP